MDGTFCNQYDRDSLIGFYRKYLLEKVFSVYDLTLPDSIDMDYFRFCLFCIGFAAIFVDTKYGVITQINTFEDFTLYLKPKYAVINTQFVQTKKLIDKDCVIVKINPNYTGIMDIVDTTAIQLAECHLSIMVNLYNTKVTGIFATENKSDADTMKELYRSVLCGDPAVFVKKNANMEKNSLAWFSEQFDIGKNYIVSDLLVDMEKIDGRFNKLIGIPDANTEKRERLVSEEVRSNNDETKALALLWEDTINKELKKASEMFNTPMSIKYKFKNSGGDGYGYMPMDS